VPIIPPMPPRSSHESGAGYQARLPSAQRTGPHVTCSGDLGLAALQHIPGSNQRAAPLLFEVLGFSAAEIATMTATSTTSVNSALARARKIVAEKVPSRTQQQTLRQFGDARVREIVTSYATALQRGDTDAWSRCSPKTSPGRCHRCRTGTTASRPSPTSPCGSR
jgi:hypothetical protein